MTPNMQDLLLSLSDSYRHIPFVDTISKEEWDDFIVSICPNPNITEKEKEHIIHLRASSLNRQFEFTEEQVLQIIKIDKLLTRKLKELYNTECDILTLMDENQDLFEEANSGHTLLEMDNLTIPKDKALYYLLEYCNKEGILPPSHSYNCEELNWNIELFSHPNLLKHNPWLGHTSHRLFCDCSTLSLYDMLEFKDEYIKKRIEIYCREFSNDYQQSSFPRKKKVYRSKEEMKKTTELWKICKEGRYYEVFPDCFYARRKKVR